MTKDLRHSEANTEFQGNSDIGPLYLRCLGAYGREPRDGEMDAWLNVLGGFGSSDIDASIRRWQADSRLDDFTHRPVGARMPTAAELKQSIEAFNKREFRLNSGRFISCGKCDDGWIRVFKGMTVGPEPGDPQPVDPKVGAVRRCKCFHEYCARKMHQSSLELPPKKQRKGLSKSEQKLISGFGDKNSMP